MVNSQPENRQKTVYKRWNPCSRTKGDNQNKEMCFIYQMETTLASFSFMHVKGEY